MPANEQGSGGRLPKRVPRCNPGTFHQAQGGEQLPTVIERRQRDTAVCAKLPLRQPTRSELLQHPPHLGRALGWLAHVAIFARSGDAAQDGLPERSHFGKSNKFATLIEYENRLHWPVGLDHCHGCLGRFYGIGTITATNAS